MTPLLIGSEIYRHSSYGPKHPLAIPRVSTALDLIRALVADLGLAVLLVTHDIAAARLLAHRMLVMRQGRVVEEGLTDRVLDDPQHEYTQLLVASVLAA